MSWQTHVTKYVKF